MGDEDDALDVNFTPPGNELVNVARRNLSGWLDYVRRNPPLTELEEKAADIMGSIQVASGLAGLETLTVELAVAVDHRFIRLGLLQPWYKRLMSLYGPLMEQSERFQADLLHMLIQLFLHDGDVARARTLIDLDLADAPPEASIAILDQAAVEVSLAESERGRFLAERLLSLAQSADDTALMARAYSVLAQFYVNRNNPQGVFECGQMVACVGIGMADDMLIVHGLHYMAIALNMKNQPARATAILEVAISRTVQSGDHLEMNYLFYTWGYSDYLLGQYKDAEAHFKACAADVFADRSELSARTAHMRGLALIKLGRLADAQKSFEESLAVWKQLNRPFDALYTQHGLAHIHWLTGHTAEAVELARTTLIGAIQSKNLRRDVLIAELRQDLNRYKKPYDPATSS